MKNDELPLYQIRDWNETFENFKSRSVKDAKFVCKPNKHGGVGLMNVLVEPDGRTIYGVWCLLLDLCSRQRTPREGWLTANGKKDGRRYRVAELAYLFRATEREIKRCLEVVTSPEVDWMTIAGRPEGDTSKSQSIASADTLQPIPDTSQPGGIAPEDTSQPEGISSRAREKEGMKEGKKEPPSVPQGGTGMNGHGKFSIEEAKQWMSKLFGRERHWSYEELHLLSDLGLIAKNDRALLSWAYTLPRDNEGWALVDGKRASKPKQNLIGLLREFSSEIDKWRSVRSNGSAGEQESAKAQEWTDERMRVFRELFPDAPIQCRFDLLGEDVQRQIDERIKEQVAA